MDYFVLIIGLLVFPMGNYADTTSSDTSVTSTSWFWPLLSVCLALILSVPCTLITVVILCHKKKHIDDSDESSIDSSSSSAYSGSSSATSHTSDQRRSMHHHHHHHHHCRPPLAHYAGGFRSPPPPYTINQQQETTVVPSSLPPPYESHISANHLQSTTLSNPQTTIINVEPADSTINQSSIIQPAETTGDMSSLFTNPSLQTFHA